MDKKTEIKKITRIDKENKKSGKDSKFKDLYNKGFTLEYKSLIIVDGRR